MTDKSTLTDNELLILLRKGDIGAFTEIHHRYYGVLYRHAGKRLPQREEIKDLLQDLFSYVWNNREKLVFNTSLAAYLYTATRNRIFNIYKHQKVKLDYVESFQQFLKHDEPIADELLREKELIALVEKEVAALPPQMRLIFELSRNQYLSHRQIADQLNISPFTVRKQVNNSLKILRLKLGAYFYMLL
ncbi:RNA polymerase sigma-70 factor [Mucilaginibacter sp. UR6-11]|uniref:RNA polymerase sigma-70 factor n=1 Tax=Mucilaginibacter sp. UR6-11 TaxID=1435644 RepID=UPI001E4ED5E2|nr:RNA polymerase sigma-70 factor [Mucilaginibacter sp. UR6-11]MCC8426390.1 RNA polymerase sigma-70 factor [Mucilaginibacter sp. UR6-11]